MRVVQIIDSLDIGGAEKMAVSFANALSTRLDFSGLIATRKEGNLKTSIEKNVNYLFLNKKHSLDIKAVLKLRKYCKTNNVTIIQAHSSSYFIACLVKLLMPKLKIIWHDHNGIGVIPKRKGASYLKLFSGYFNGIIAVNSELAAWSRKHLKSKQIIFLQNFVKVKEHFVKTTILKGENGKRVLYLANLRHQKNHMMFLDAIKKINNIHPDWTFHLVGNDSNDDYSKKIKLEIINSNLQDAVFIYGSKQDIENIITQVDIAVFTSNSEGLPVALLEYGMFKIPVVSTNVGEIPFIVEHNKCGFISEINNAKSFSLNLQKLIENKDLRVKFGNELYSKIVQNYSEEVVIQKYLNWLKLIKLNAK
jgi:glycosyltransferase involved in cell wall biosynthesis